MIYEYDIPATFPDGLDLLKLDTALKGSSLGQKYYGSWTGGSRLSLEFIASLTPTEVAALDSLMSGLNDPGLRLREAKDTKFSEIDAKTDQIFLRGFQYMDSGIFLSLSIESQSRMTGLMLIKDSPQTVYPIRWNGNDDAQYVDLLDAAMVVNMYGCAAATLRSYVDGGTAIKNQVRAATTVAQVLAIPDNR